MSQANPGGEMRGLTLLDREGQRIGKIDDLYVDTRDEHLKWALVNTGLFGSKKSFVPLQGATQQDEDVLVPFDKGKVKDAPRIEADAELSEEEERRLFQHYGMASAAAPETRTTAGASGDDAMTRSEEELRVGTQTREAGRARLRKYVVTEHEQRSVPVRHEEVRLEREPIDESNRAQAVQGADIQESEHEVVLHEETPVVEKKVTPKERVRMTTETQQEEQTIAGDVRKERIEAEGDITPPSQR